MKFYKKIVYSFIFCLINYSLLAEFSKDFCWGIAISAHQNCGAAQLKNSSWAHWEKSPGRIIDDEQSGIACDHWNRYKEDIQLMQEQVHVNSFRFSVDWSAIEPQEEVFNQQALNYYRDYCQALLDAGIKPMVTLHHFSHPQWFEEKQAFEKEENIGYFVRFCRKVYETIGDQVSLWCTINEPSIYVLQGYFRGVFPPGKRNVLQGIRVLAHLMQAHTRVYIALKEMSNSKKQECQIGLAHQYLKFVPHNPYHIIERMPGYIFNYLLNEPILEFCKTGNFEVRLQAPQVFSKLCALMPQGISRLMPAIISYKSSYGKVSDYIGLNYYSRVVVRQKTNSYNPFNVDALCFDGETMTDMQYAIYGEGLYGAITDIAHKTDLPIYVTENGIADSQVPDERRALFLKEYLSALERAVYEGYSVKGYYYWSLMDNFEWDMGTKMRFGLYAVDFKTQERTLREGAKQYIEFIEKHS